MTPRTRYARSGDLRIAYQVVGDGPIDLVHAPGYISHLEHAWEEPGFAHYLRRLAAFSRLILFDKRGTGLSDRVAGIPPLAERMDDVRAVMDAAGSERAVIYGFSESTELAVLFAATYPHRTRALTLLHAYASEVRAPDYPWAPTPEEAAQAIAEEAETIDAEWGTATRLEFFAPSRMHDPAFVAWFSAFERLSASPGALLALDRMNAIVDVRHVLPTIQAPTLVLTRAGTDPCVVAQSRYVAAHIPGAQFVVVPGIDYLPQVGDSDALVDEIEAFVTGVRPSTRIDAVLATVLAAELVDPAQQALARGDRRWSDGTARFQEAARQLVVRFHGALVHAGGERLTATFDAPGRAIRAALALTAAASALDLPVRCGLHIGECLLRGDRLQGVALALAGWIASQAAPNEIVVSGAVRDLLAGADLRFVDRGVRMIPGQATTWRVYAVPPEQAAEARGADVASLVGPRRPPGPAGQRLSIRERDVLRLIAAGCTNAEIGDTLVISPRTASTHASHMLDKLGLTSRAELIAFAHQHGLA